MPPSFVEETWVNWLPKAVAKPFYRDQLTAHIAELERQISNLSREIERQSGGLLDQRDAAVDPTHTLVSSKRVAKRQLLHVSFARTSLFARTEDTISFSN